jgi:DNA-binding response OmpR family regulator
VKLLLADDDRVFQLMLGRTLPKWGFEPIVVSSGEEAWQHLRSPGGPSIAILDWIIRRMVRKSAAGCGRVIWRGMSTSFC